LEISWLAKYQNIQKNRAKKSKKNQNTKKSEHPEKTGQKYSTNFSSELLLNKIIHFVFNNA
jgi:hypothetical protein